MEDNRELTVWTLTALLLVALGLRIWGIDFGLPHIYNADEAHEVYRALQLGTGSFNLGRIAKGGYFYLLFVEYALYFVALWVFGSISSPEDFAILCVKDPTALWLIGRTTTALLGTLTVFLTYLLGKRAYGTSVGLMGAALLAVTTLHVEDSHYISVNVPVTLLVTAAMLCLLTLVRTGARSTYLGAGLFIGLALQTKLSSAVIGLSYLVAHALRAWREGIGPVQAVINRRLAYGALCAASIYVVGTPGIVLRGAAVLRETLWLFTPRTEAFLSVVGNPVEVLQTTSSPWVGLMRGLLQGFGLPALLLCLGGLIVALWRRTAADLLLASFCLIHYMLVASSRTLWSVTYLDPMLPCFVVLGARSMIDVSRWVRRPRFRFALLSTATVALCVYPGYSSVQFDRWLSREDTRTLAKDWIETNIPANSRILIDAGRFQTHTAPPIQESRENIRARIEALGDSDKGKKEFLRLKMEHLEGKTYDLTSTVWGTEVQDLSYYRENGFRYIVISESVKRKFSSPLAEELFPNSVAFYRSLEASPGLRLLKRFEATPKRPGPGIAIYEIIP